MAAKETGSWLDLAVHAEGTVTGESPGQQAAS